MSVIYDPTTPTEYAKRIIRHLIRGVRERRNLAITAEAQRLHEAHYAHLVSTARFADDCIDSALECLAENAAQNKTGAR